MPKTLKQCINFKNLRKTHKRRDISKIKHYNKITDSYLDKSLIKTLCKEFASRTKESDELPPTKFNKFSYSQERKKNDNYGRIFSYNGKKTCLVDFDILSKHHSLFVVGDFQISNNEQYISYTVDTVGDRLFSLYLKPFNSNKPKLITTNCAQQSLFSSDSQFLYYIKYDMQDLRPCKLYAYNICKETSKLIFEQKNRSQFISLKESSDKMNIILNNGSYNERTPYVVYPDKVIKAYKTKKHFRVYLDHWMNKWYILKKAHNTTQILASDDLKHFDTIIPYKPDTIIEKMIIKSHNIIYCIRKDNLRELVIYNIDSKKSHHLSLSNIKYSVLFPYLSNLNIHEPIITLKYSTFINPYKLININLDTFKITHLYDFSSKSYSSSKYKESLIKINEHVYITITSLKDNSLKNKKCVLYGYGSYGANIEPVFDSSIISLLDRGFIYCIAHIRGSSVNGYNSWLDGKMLNKKNTFKDFIDAAQWLIYKKYTSPDKLTIWGRSAGGLLIANVINNKPKLANLAILGVPFVDVIGTMTDSCQPLVTEEYEEWGNPENTSIYEYMESYDPMYNINLKLDYPNLYIYSNINDTNVTYPQVLKYFERIKNSAVFSAQDKFALLQINLKYGHGQASKKNERREQRAEILSLIIEQ